MISIYKTNYFFRDIGYLQAIKPNIFRPINHNNLRQSICLDIGKVVNKILYYTRIKLRTVYRVSNIIVVKISYLGNICRIYRAKIYICLKL